MDDLTWQQHDINKMVADICSFDNVLDGWLCCFLRELNVFLKECCLWSVSERLHYMPLIVFGLSWQDAKCKNSVSVFNMIIFHPRNFAPHKIKNVKDL